MKFAGRGRVATRRRDSRTSGGGSCRIADDMLYSQLVLLGVGGIEALSALFVLTCTSAALPCVFGRVLSVGGSPALLPGGPGVVPRPILKLARPVSIRAVDV